MWCKQCQQDVPGIADGERAMVCARCAAVLQLPVAAVVVADEDDLLATDAAATGSPAGASDEPPWRDDWQWDEQISAAERLLKAYRPGGNDGSAWMPSTSVGADATRANRGPSTNHHDESKPQGSWLAWGFLLAGTTALVCGGVLAGWSYFGARAALWNLGLPVLLGGQASLLLGIVLQVERMWRNGRLAAQRLAEVDRELVDLHQTTTLLGNTYGGGSSTFFAHLAEGASPHLLMADLKGQMDLLAMKVSRGG